ncbi:MAG TPA: hypothetical protein VIB39_19645 [Candidatus Angelobacter sp.]|jgi:hypothetical protein
MKIFRYLRVAFLLIPMFALMVGAQQNQGEWISLCSKCLSPSVTSKSGTGTTNAVAVGKVTLKDAQMWCGSWEPDNQSCPKEQLANEKGQIYKISANCPAGKFTSPDDVVYTHTNEVWDASDIGQGRPKFRGADGAIVGRDDASGGLDLAANWELLCGAAAAAVDACAGKQHCDSNKLFSAEVIGLSGTIVGGRHHYVKMNIRFHNLSDHPIILAYVTGSSSGVDNLGNAYYWGRAGTHDASTAGIGLLEGRKADTQFQLDPGESRNAMFGIIRYEAARKPIGSSFTYNMTIAELRKLGGTSVESLKQYTMNFPHLPGRGW